MHISANEVNHKLKKIESVLYQQIKNFG